MWLLHEVVTHSEVPSYRNNITILWEFSLYTISSGDISTLDAWAHSSYNWVPPYCWVVLTVCMNIGGHIDWSFATNCTSDDKHHFPLIIFLFYNFSPLFCQNVFNVLWSRYSLILHGFICNMHYKQLICEQHSNHWRQSVPRATWWKWTPVECQLGFGWETDTQT